MKVRLDRCTQGALFTILAGHAEVQRVTKFRFKNGVEMFKWLNKPSWQILGSALPKGDANLAILN